VSPISSRKSVPPSATWKSPGRVAVAPRVDGKDAEPGWADASYAGPFLAPDGARAPAEQSWFAGAWDATHVYLIVAAREALLNPVLQRTHEVRSRETQPDGNVFRDECIELFLQPDPGRAEYFHLAVNSNGVLYDARCRNGAFDKAWSSDARVAVNADLEQWRAEFAIPLKAVGAAPEVEAQWGVNVCRHRGVTREYSCWAPTGASFHNPGAFGRLQFGNARAAGVRQVTLPRLMAGPGTIRFEVGANGPVTATVLIRYGTGPWAAVSTHYAPPDSGWREMRLPYRFGLRDDCLHIDAAAAKADNTLCFRTGKLPVTGGSVYRFGAMVKTEDLTSGGRPLAFSISSYDAKGEPIKTYETVAAAPTGTHDWQPVEAVWTAPATAAEILFWTVKWGKSGVTGQAWMDDLFLCADGSPVNLLPNGAVETGEDGRAQGWPVLSRTRVAERGRRAATASVAVTFHSEAGELLYASPVRRGAVEKRSLAIGTMLQLAPGKRDATGLHRVTELYVNQGGYLSLPFVLRSSRAGALDWAEVIVEAPAWLRLVAPSPRAALRDCEPVLRQGNACLRYRVRVDGRKVSPVEPELTSTQVIPFIFACGRAGELAADVYVRFHGVIDGAEEEPNELPLHVLPPLQWKRPRTALIKNWACGSFYRAFRQLSVAEQDVVVRTWRQAGFNRSGAVLAAAHRVKYGFSARGHIPLITAPGHVFKGGREYLAEHPEAHAVAFDGKRVGSVFCPLYFLSDANTHRAEACAWLAHEARRYPHLDWDYEAPTVRDTSICVCERCVAAFRAHARLSADLELTPDRIRGEFRKQWVDFCCRRNADLALYFRGCIKEANPDCLFSIYSGYQGTTDERYGVDWRYMAEAADLIWCGYGRPVAGIAATHAAIGDRPFIGGELAWYGSHPWNNAIAEVALFRRVSDCGAGVMTYFNWIVDGRFYRAVSRVASVK